MGTQFCKNDPKPGPYSQRNRTRQIQCHSLSRPDAFATLREFNAVFDLVISGADHHYHGWCPTGVVVDFTGVPGDPAW